MVSTQVVTFTPLNHSTRFSLLRGAGCIFVEMVTGIALFPGMRDSVDQLNKIWQVGVTSVTMVTLDTEGYVVGHLVS